MNQQFRQISNEHKQKQRCQKALEVFHSKMRAANTFWTFLNVTLTLYLGVCICWHSNMCPESLLAAVTRSDPQMVCASINTTVVVLICLYAILLSFQGPCGVVDKFGALFLTWGHLGSFDYFGALGGWVTTLQCAAQK